MKKYLFIAFAITLSTGCTKNPNLTTKESSSITTLNSECGSQLSEFPFWVTSENEDEIIDSLAVWHNEYLAYYLQSLIDSNIRDTSHASFDVHFRTTAQNFFTSKGISFLDNEYYWCNTRGPLHHESDPDAAYDFLSDFGDSITTALKSTLLENPSVNEFDQYCQNAYNSVMGIPSEDERQSLKLLIKVTQHSYRYWTENAEAWEEHFELTARKVNLGGVAWADGEGAFVGAIGGIYGGPATIFAFGLVSAGWYSANDILKQVIFS